MRLTVASYAVGLQLLGLLSLWPLAAWAELPRRDFVVELRQVAESQNGADEPVTYSSTPSTANGLAPQQVRVQNGEKAQVRITQSQPMQWVQSATSQNATLRAGSATATQQTGSVTHAVTPVEAGQTLVLTPRWLGGSRPVSVAIDLQTVVVDERTSGDLPTTQRQQVLTTVTAPLRQWVTIATAGTSTPRNTYSSAGTGNAMQLIQIRISPP